MIKWHGRWRIHPYLYWTAKDTLQEQMLNEHLNDKQAVLHKQIIKHDDLPAHQHMKVL